VTVSQVVECLFKKGKALSSNSGTSRERERDRETEAERQKDKTDRVKQNETEK
jgi:hypothetical protein